MSTWADDRTEPLSSSDIRSFINIKYVSIILTPLYDR